MNQSVVRSISDSQDSIALTRITNELTNSAPNRSDVEEMVQLDRDLKLSQYDDITRTFRNCVLVQTGPFLVGLDPQSRSAVGGWLKPCETATSAPLLKHRPVRA
jgi:hypothetical protein